MHHFLVRRWRVLLLPFIAVAALAALTLPSNALAANANLTGTVNGPAGTGIGNVDVQVYTASGNSVNDAYTSTTSGSVGQFSVTVPNAGVYYVFFDTSADDNDANATTDTGGNAVNVAKQWYGAPASPAGLSESNAAPVTVAASGTALPTVQLAAGTTITGKVANGATAEGGTVAALDSSDDEVGGDDQLATATFTAGGGGAYTLTGLPAGPFYLRLAPNSSSWVGGYYNSANSGALVNFFNEGSAVTTATSGAVTANVNAQAPGSITGLVQSGGSPVPDVAVHIYDASGQELFSGPYPSGDDGTYTISDLLPGAYKLKFVSNAANLGFEFSGNQSTYGGAAAVTVNAGSPTAAGTTSLVQGGAISGTVINTSSAPLSDVEVSLVDSTGYVYESAFTANNGTYTLFNVPAGSWYIQFNPADVPGSTVYQTQYYGGKQVLAGSTPVGVTAGSTTSPVSAVLQSGSTAGQLTTVTTTTTVATPIPTDTGTSTVSGDVKVGHKLSAKVGSWQSGSTYSYQWYANGKAIKGATSSTYTVTGGYYKHTIQVAVTGKKSGYNWTTVLSKATAKVAEGSLTTHTPTISGKATVGTTLKASATKWTAGTKFSYQWYASGKAIKGATKSSSKVPSADKGKTITVKVTGKLTGYKSVAKSSKATAKVG